MLEKNITTPGKIYTAIQNLSPWDKNPRTLDAKDFERLKHQIKELGMYKPLLVTQDGIVIGGNMRLRALQELGAVNVWITEISFQEVAGATPNEDGSIPVQAIIDDELQPRIFKTKEQAMIEYALSDNDTAGMYNQTQLAELLIPVQNDILPDYKLELAPSVAMQTFVNQYQPSDQPPGDLPGGKKEKDKEIHLLVKYTPQQFEDMEPKINEVKTHAGLSNLTDVFSHLIHHYLANTNGNTTNEPAAPAEPGTGGGTPDGTGSV